MDPEPDNFDKARVPAALDETLRSVNPWWRNLPGRQIPSFRRTLFPILKRKLESGPAPIVVLRGARQVGKTTLQEQLIDQLLRDGVDPKRILRVQFDDLEGLSELLDPILVITRWFESRVLGKSLNQAASAHQPAFLFLDEVQNLARWAPQLKHLVDHHTCRVAVTGSSALRIQSGEDSLAGRLDTLEIGTLSLREIAGLAIGVDVPALLEPNGLAPLRDVAFWRALVEHGERHAAVRNEAFRRFSERGGYPLAQQRGEIPFAELGDQLHETVVRRVIRHDLRMGERGRKRDESLLEEVFRLACRYAGQAPKVAMLAEEVRQARGANVGDQRVREYLRFLDGALLVRLVQPIEIRLKKQRAAPRICLVDHALRQVMLQESVPLDPAALAGSPQQDLAGHVAESALGAFLCGITHLDVSWSPEQRDRPELDYVLTLGDLRIPIEVKYRSRIDPTRDLSGLVAFLDQPANRAPFGLLVTRHEGVRVEDPRVVPISLRSLLLLR
ncbi:MAG: ATP-binding protein [Planctomycetes bacterium]|nr:ATP-binding protein [Planctomycetota bacterium]